MYKIGYEETDRKEIVEIYGLEFELKRIDNKLYDDLKNLKAEDINNFDELYKFVDLFLGDGASVKINEKRNADGYDKMNYENIMAILDLVFKVQENKINAYTKKMNNYEKNYNNYRRRRY